ncbi:CehA/McbA family metallohydrolase [Dinghuibacter silviterrae]|uniref:PHP domain-containing protein n=1 Tax=Dinghuibacter silviterrae TaxID=1539049 RepID=A0A4R8DHI9_9BACT|nr:CehA/McbA family metallohydrolase [Dinghuibacter silviterrae]TDW96908.1 PHP domain-containing protein [Dinghuibacter silviterrae]
MVWLLLLVATLPYKILKGKVERKDFHTYIERSFTLPKGVKRLRIEFSYDGREQRTAIDIGLMDPERFRGWSGGARNTFTISEEEATPGYLPGVLPAGQWTLLLGVPNIREGVVSNYEARIYINESSDKPIHTEAGWYRGDLHIHSGHSDGKCAAQSGVAVPCPVYRVVETAVNKGLDFIAVTDHNTTSQADALRELQPAFDKILLVPGREITTFYGHANIFGVTDFIDFRTTDATYAAARGWMNAVNKSGGIISINHPGLPSGENCMGCGWQIKDIPDKVITAVEVVNGATMNHSIGGWDLWHQMLNSGQHVTAIGGSDDHHAENIGTPTTVIYMKALSVQGLIDGIRSGRVFIDMEGDKNHFLDVLATHGRDTVYMGGVLKVAPSDTINVTAYVKGVSGGKVEFIMDGQINPALSRDIASNDEKIQVDPESHWHTMYVKVLDKEGKLALVGNPVYVDTQCAEPDSRRR